MTPSTITATRRAWHGVGELVLAGAQYRRTKTIRLRVQPGGFATTKEPELRVVGGDLVHRGGSVPIDGRTCGELAAAAGVDVGAPDGVYHDGSGLGPDDVLQLDIAATTLLADAFAMGDAALRRLDAAETPVLWPEHFDLGVSVGKVNYGVSTGDGYLDQPYAYVGPWEQRTGSFWNAPFGAARPLAELPDVDAIVAFFATGRDLATHR